MNRLLVIAGAGEYPQLLIRGARAAGVGSVDVVAVKGSCPWATRHLADHAYPFAVGDCERCIAWVASQRYDGVVMAGQVSPMSLFSGKFGPVVREWLREMPVKNAHTIFGKLVSEFEKAGVNILPASSFMEANLPGEGCLTARNLSAEELDDVARGMQVAADVGRHDVGQTVLVKSGMVLAVEAFEGTNAAIRRAGKLGKGSVLCKAAREGHDWRFDIPVIGLKTLKVMKSSGVTALAFQAGRQLLLNREAVIRYADRHGIAIVGMKTQLPAAPTRP